MAKTKQPWMGMDRTHDVAQWLNLIALGSLGSVCFCATIIFAHITSSPVNERLCRAAIKRAM